LITLGERRMPCFDRLSMSLFQFDFSKSKHPVRYCERVLFKYLNSKNEELKKGNYFTVTDFAKFLGMSGLYPFSSAM
jgi:hypothetical protein